MTLMTADAFKDSLRRMSKRVFMFGEEIKDPTDHPVIQPSVNAVAMTYELGHHPDHEALLTAESSLTGKRINRFTHLHQSTDDLVKKVKMLRLLGQCTGCCFQRCVGMDSFNAVDIVSDKMDQALGTNYNLKFREYLKHVQDEDLVVDGCMTDPKGNRALPPGEQADPDLFLHVIDESKEGITIRGAKVHQTGAINSHEILVMPTRSLKETDKDYAVACAIPADVEGIIYVYGRQASDTRKLEAGEIDVGNYRFGGHEAVVIFNDVFVPWERVFMCGEYQFTGEMVETFAAYHRSSYGGCKVGVGDVLIGATKLIATYQGVENASHIKDKLVEMIHLNETLYACGLACSTEGVKTTSGTYLVDMALANICKLNVTRFPYQIASIAQDIAGGLLVTMPSEKDFSHPEIGPLLEKYLVGAESYPTEWRQRILRLIENLTIGLGAVGYLAESMHGAGSPMAQRIMLSRLTDMEHKEGLAATIAGIKEK
ncbi:MAG: 4-hydroxyphenylacetate 3-hydroxylase family protein [Anaerolineaceae bacterium]|nr:MAG: 4-hydroxyphenylacetate 3-hydroxylase family protein [Anaerolineaceae bacterium]